MFPVFASEHRLDGRVTDSQGVGHSCGRKGALSDPQHLGFGELGVASSFANRKSVAVNSFIHVLGLSTRMKMGGLNADGSVAGMQDEGAVGGNLAYENLVGHSVGQLHIDDAVSVGVGGADPVPASFCWWLPGHEVDKGFSGGHSPRTGQSDAAKGIAMTLPALVVGAAPALAPQRCGGIAEQTASSVCVETNGHDLHFSEAS